MKFQDRVKISDINKTEAVVIIFTLFGFLGFGLGELYILKSCRTTVIGLRDFFTIVFDGESFCRYMNASMEAYIRTVNVAKKTHMLMILSVRKEGAIRMLIIIEIKSKLNLNLFDDLNIS
jgi:hypothetical protein